MTMTTKPKTSEAKAPARAPKRRRARAITEAEAAAIAAMDFEPWQEVDTKKLPNNEQFMENGLSHLITCRMALVMMYRTKAELSEMFEKDGDTMCGLVENMESAKNFFSHFSELLDAASARLFAAGFSGYQNTPEKCGERGRESGNA